MNKKIISSLLTLIICLSTASTTFGVTSKTPVKKTVKSSLKTPLKLSSRELAIIKAYTSTLNTGDLKYIKSYTHPKLTLTLPAIPDDTHIKIILPTYEKTYDVKKKSYALIMKGLAILSNGENVQVANIIEGTYVTALGKTVYAYGRYDTSTTPADVNKLTKAQYVELKKWLVRIYGQKQSDAILTLNSSQNTKTKS